jgi:protein-S-isoprenylcysteine O-methyltransferase Ste14
VSNPTVEQAEPERPQGDSAGVRFPPPLYFVAGLAVGFAIESWLGGPLFPRQAAPGFWLVPGAGLIVAGLVSAVSGMVTMKRMGSNIRPDRPATALVVRGPYRWTRNPMYVGLGLVSAGIAVAANAVWPLLMVVVTLAIVRRRVIAREEAYLERAFGREYRRYRDRVPRWL